MKLLCLLGVLSLYIALISAQNDTLSTESPSNDTTVAPEGTTATSEKPAVMTTVSEPTTAQTPTPSPGGNLYALREGNITCILLSVDMVMNITYTMKNDQNASAQFPLPLNNSVTVGGSCVKADQKLELEWFVRNTGTKFTLIMNFNENSKNEQYVKDIIFDYEITEALFPNATGLGAKKVNVSGEFFKVSESNQYLCKSNTTTKIEEVEMLTSELKLQAFRTTNTTTFSGDSQQCKADAETNNIVPIAVGAALAALVVIVLIAYLISRNRNKGGYESV